MKCLLLLAALSTSMASEYPSPGIREERTVVVNGLTEVWRLEWRTPPHPVCEPIDTSLTCPCEGFAYGEAGELDVVRLIKGREIDRFHVPDFEDAPEMAVILQRWQPDYEKDWKDSWKEGFAAAVARRPTVQIMNFADYDHDGRPTEFFLETSAGPCGHVGGVVVGVSKANGRLHLFSSAAEPGESLYLDKHEWESLARANEPIEVVDVACGDHGADTEVTVRLGWEARGITVARRRRRC